MSGSAVVFRTLLVVGATAIMTTNGPAQQAPPYPQENLSPWYEVEPDWPQRPAEFGTAAVPGLAVDAADNIWVFTRTKPPVQVYRPDGTFVKAWGEDIIETAHHMKIDREGHIWLADIGRHTVEKFTPEGERLLTIGTPGVAGRDQTHLNKPTDMAIAPGGDVFVTDGYGNNRVVHFDREGRYIKEWGQLGTGPDDFSLPHAIVMDSQGLLYIADRNNVRVQVYDQRGQLVDSWQHLLVPWGFWLTENDDIWVCGSSPMPWQTHPDYPDAPLGCPPKDQVIMRFKPGGKLQQLWTIPKGKDGQEQPGDLNWVHAVAMDSQGNLYAGDIIGQRVQKFVRRK